MPKSKHRKNQKQKSRARTERLNAQKRTFNKKCKKSLKSIWRKWKIKSLVLKKVT